MKKVLTALLFLPMLLIGIYYGVCFSTPSNSDTIPAASMLIGLLLVALPMLILSVINVILYIVSIKCNNRQLIMISTIAGMITPIASFLWLFVISSFNVYLVTGIYAFISLILGIVLLKANSSKNTD
ncbi:MAG: hypothetical protein IKL31_09925 [Ruminococcus sp.]|nr:hypothetical protein [Ruminococcus sp.]